ncbi:F-box protein At4g00755-like [Andrographis paniculata]|uniref:F-box protein At4g00755-like n=1 Tax=Andrographis paniculata TaxID=175694 RepID=UPI0021E7391C|nr:F-box protein At4g00755-like [Andrographis paniculata]
MLEGIHVDSVGLFEHGNRNNSRRFRALEKQHKVFNYLLSALSKANINPKDIVQYVIGASSTRNYPKDSVVNVLLPSDLFYYQASQWSSTGHTHGDVCESILFKLDGGICIVTHVDIQPFQVRSHEGDLIFSASSVRFKMGQASFPRSLNINVANLPLNHINDEWCTWRYTSPEFPMEQRYELQTFKLPEPVLCVGGFLKVELIGMAERDTEDNMYYHRLMSVNIYGHSLKPAFDVRTTEGGEMQVTCNASEVHNVLRRIPMFFVARNYAMLEDKVYQDFLQEGSTTAAQILTMIDEVMHDAQ